MARSTFRVLFYANGSKEKNGIVPIMGRVTINGTVAQFSCKRSIAKELWDAKGNRVKGKSREARETNLALDNIKAQIIKHYQRISDREAYVTAEMVRNAYQGIGCEYETILGAFDKENAKFLKRVGKDRCMGSYRVMVRSRNYVAAFIKSFYKRNDISMLELTPDFIKELQTERQQAERQLDEVRKEIKSEKLEAAKTEAKAALVAKVGSLLGSNKLKAEREELQQRISALERQNEMLVQHIETMEQEHKEERTKFNEYIDKIQRYFPYVEKLLPLIDFCRNTLKFSERVVQELCKLKKVRLKGDFYSPEFNRKFHDESAAFSFEEDKNRKGHYHICVNDIPLVQWFRQKANEWRNGLGIASARQDKGLKI